MNTQTDFDDEEIETEVQPKSETDEIILPFATRELFRPKLMEFFEMTNKRQGAYRWAEEKALDYFEKKMNIPRSAWNYRTRVH